MENIAVRNGVYMGVALVVLNFLLYFMGVSWLMSAGWIGFLIYIIFMAMSVKEERTLQNGFISFGDAFKSSFLSYVVGALISVLFTYVLYNFIDPGVVEEIKDVTAEQMEKLGDFMGGEDFEAAMEKAIDDINYSLPTLLMGYLVSLIFPGAIIAAIIAAIMKKSNDNPYA